MILDTSIIIDLLRGNKETKKKIEEIENKNITLVTTSISVFEVFQGISFINNDNKDKIYSLFESINILDFDNSSAREGGIIQSNLKKEGKMIDPEDAMIAGIAKIHGEIILTRNKKHFERIKGLNFESY